MIDFLSVIPFWLEICIEGGESGNLFTLMTCKPSNKSWFCMLKEICLQYGLLHPLHLLTTPPAPNAFKSLCKSKIQEYWRRELASKISAYSSQRYLRPDYISLCRPNPL